MNGVGAGPMTRRVRGAAGAALVVLATAIGPLAPANARIASLSKSSDTVSPGESTTVTVNVQHDGQTCISVDSLDGASVAMRGDEGACDDEASWSRTYVVSAASVGDHRVRFGDDRAGDTQVFTLRVREAPPPPPPPPPTTATTARPPTTTTTARRTTTTAAPTTEAPATTTTSAVAGTTTTTAAAPPPPGGGFVPVASLVAEGVPELGVFLPLIPGGYRTCLPLSEPCVDPASAIVLVPARTTELVWPTIGEDERSAPRVDLRGVPPLLPVGRAPDDQAAQDYALPVVDLAEGGQLRTLLRGLDDQGRLVTAHVGSAVAAPVAEGPMAAPETTTFLASSPFGRPRLATKDQFTEAAPAVVLFSATELQPVYAIRADPSWGLDVEVLPLYTAEGVPYLVRGVDGPPGLYLRRPDGLRIPQAGSGESTAADDPVAEGEGVPAVALLGGAVGVATIATVALGWRRRRSLADPQ